MGTSGKTQKREYLDKPTLYATIPTNAGGNFGLDALHLALCALHRETILTADRRLARAAGLLGVRFHLVSA